MKLMHKCVVSKLAQHWSVVGDYLEYPLDARKEFYALCNGDPKECIKMLLDDWIGTENGRKPKTWLKFVEVLNEIGNCEGQPLLDITAGVVQSLLNEGVLGGTVSVLCVCMLCVCARVCVCVRACVCVEPEITVQNYPDVLKIG